jgi:regulator of RNase E activity RraA
VGDADGVAVVPRVTIEDVLRQATIQLEKEAALRRDILAGKNLFDLLGLEASPDIAWHSLA